MFSALMKQLWDKKFAFFGTFFLVFSLFYLVLVAIDFVPETKTAFEAELPAEENVPSLIEQSADNHELPVGTLKDPVPPTMLYIEKLDRTITIQNPDSRNVADLDVALLEGAVRHPDSALLGENGNVFILGHSSYLPTVLNKNFQAFNGIQDLKWGDTIEVHSASSVIVYEVEKVFKAKAGEVTVPIADTGPRLTLATCNSFGSVDDRYIVEAKAVAVRQL